MAGKRIRMKKFLLYVFAALMIFGCGEEGGGGGSASLSTSLVCPNPSTENIQYMGFYWGMSKVYGNHVDSFKDYTNMVNIHVTGDWDHDVQLIEEAIAKGLAPLPYMDGRLIWLNNDWSKRTTADHDLWDIFVEKMSPYVEHFAGFYVFDEPYLYGLSVDTQEWIISYYKTAFPDTLTWVTYVRRGYPIPSNLDVVSVTPSYGEINGGQYKTYILDIKLQMYSHQRIALTLDTYHSDSYISTSYHEWKADVAQEYFQVAKCDPKVIALYMFIYPTFSGGLGVEDMAILEDELINIWDEIQTNNESEES
jgi:hypothetical protein